MNILHLISYGNDNFKNSKVRLFDECIESKFFHNINIYNYNDLDTNFVHDFEKIFRYPRGNGYWIWKPYLIKKKLEEINDGEIVIYLDAGCTLNKYATNKFNEYIELLNNYNIVCFNSGYPEKNYTTNEIFKQFNINENSNSYNSEQLIATALLIKKCKNTEYIFDNIMKILYCNPLIITDFYNNDISNNNDFITNRHDQSIISLAIKEFGENIKVIPKDETWFVPFGNNESLKYPFWATKLRI